MTSETAKGLVRGWTVRVGYIAQDKELKWSEYNHREKIKARNVFNNLRGSAQRIQVLKDGKLQFEVRQAELVVADEFATVFLRAFLQ